MKLKFPVEIFTKMERCPITNQWVERATDTLEWIEGCAGHIRASFGDAVADRFLKMVPRATGIASGRNRVTLLMGKYVVKFPLNGYGYGDNDWEGSLDDDGYIHLARTRMHYFHDTPIIFMEQVTMPKTRENLPDWCDFVDCQQVGYTKTGKLVAFDYGMN